MNKKTILGVSSRYFYFVISFLFVGIVIGSFFDFQINELLANKTDFGAFFATYGSYFSYCLYPAAGMCFYLGFRKKGNNFKLLSNVLLVVCYFLAVYYSNSYNGSKVRALFNYTAGESSIFLSVLSWLFWVVLYAWVPVVTYHLLDDADPDKLIMVGATIMVAGLVSDNVNLWLKQVASRPRYKYLITLEKPLSEYRNWWQMIPNFAGSNDNFKSWPSGNMTIASMMFALPLLADVSKKASKKKNIICFILACFFVLAYGYNRIHMTNHFLTDVCFGTLITYLIHGVINVAFQKAIKK